MIGCQMNAVRTEMWNLSSALGIAEGKTKTFREALKYDIPLPVYALSYDVNPILVRFNSDHYYYYGTPGYVNGSRATRHDDDDDDDDDNDNSSKRNGVSETVSTTFTTITSTTQHTTNASIPPATYNATQNGVQCCAKNRRVVSPIAEEEEEDAAEPYQPEDLEVQQIVRGEAHLICNEDFDSDFE